jgi:hypothetical protein
MKGFGAPQFPRLCGARSRNQAGPPFTDRTPWSDILVGILGKPVEAGNCSKARPAAR